MAASGGFAAGNKAKSDCVARYFPGTGELSIGISSSVASLFGKAIEAAARAEAEAFGAGGRIELEDDGALDYVIAARVEAALRAAGLERRADAASDLGMFRDGEVAGLTAAPANASAMAAGPSAQAVASVAVAAAPASQAVAPASQAAALAPAPAPASQVAAKAAAPEGPRFGPLRSRLYIPGNQPELQPNIGLFGADCVLLDLEDSVPPERKAEARILARCLLESHRVFFGASEIAVRVNPLSGPYGLQDLEEVVPAAPRILVLPKCESAADVEAFDRELSRLEAASGLPVGSTLFMPIAETARGVSAALAVASASSRNVALCFGAEDYRRDMGLSRGEAEEELATARGLVALAARAAGIEAQDTVFSDIDDPAGMEASARRGKACGFSGKGLLHPCQIEIAHCVFSPSEAEIARAERIVAAMAEAEAAGRGAVSFEGSMIDAPVAARARGLLAAVAARLGVSAAGGEGGAGMALSDGLAAAREGDTSSALPAATKLAVPGTGVSAAGVSVVKGADDGR